MTISNKGHNCVTWDTSYQKKKKRKKKKNSSTKMNFEKIIFFKFHAFNKTMISKMVSNFFLKIYPPIWQKVSKWSSDRRWCQVYRTTYEKHKWDWWKGSHISYHIQWPYNLAQEKKKKKKHIREIQDSYKIPSE